MSSGAQSKKNVMASPTDLYKIETRLSLVEDHLTRIEKTRWWIQGIAVVVVLQLIAVGVSYGKLINTIESMDVRDLQKNITTALSVLGQHGQEFQDVRDEQLRLRTVMDQFHKDITDLRRTLDDRTQERFYKAEGLALDARIQRIENLLFETTIRDGTRPLKQ